MTLTNDQLLEELSLDHTIDKNGTIEYRLDGKLHRTTGPAVTYSSGTEHWYQNGEYHRDGGPAIINVTGTEKWYQHDKLHREDGPAIIYSDGTAGWYLHGELVRVSRNYYGKRSITGRTDAGLYHH